MTPIRKLSETLSNLPTDEIEKELILYMRDLMHANHPTEGDRGCARQFAEKKGYFWLPCSICGMWRGGHEPSYVGIKIDNGLHMGICDSPACKEEAIRLESAFPLGLENYRLISSSAAADTSRPVPPASPPPLPES